MYVKQLIDENNKEFVPIGGTASTYNASGASVDVLLERIGQEIAQLEGLSGTNFLGIFETNAQAQAECQSKGYDIGWAMIGTSISSLECYRVNSTTSVRIGTETYDFTDFSEIKEQVSQLAHKVGDKKIIDFSSIDKVNVWIGASSYSTSTSSKCLCINAENFVNAIISFETQLTSRILFLTSLNGVAPGAQFDNLCVGETGPHIIEGNNSFAIPEYCKYILVNYRFSNDTDVTIKSINIVSANIGSQLNEHKKRIEENYKRTQVNIDVEKEELSVVEGKTFNVDGSIRNDSPYSIWKFDVEDIDSIDFYVRSTVGNAAAVWYDNNDNIISTIPAYSTSSGTRQNYKADKPVDAKYLSISGTTTKGNIIYFFKYKAITDAVKDNKNDIDTINVKLAEYLYNIKDTEEVIQESGVGTYSFLGVHAGDVVDSIIDNNTSYVYYKIAVKNTDAFIKGNVPSAFIIKGNVPSAYNSVVFAKKSGSSYKVISTLEVGTPLNNKALIAPAGCDTLFVSLKSTNEYYVHIAKLVEKTTSSSSNINNIFPQKTAIILPLAGQSLSQGEESIPAISIVNRYANCYKIDGNNVVELAETTYDSTYNGYRETPLSGMTYQFVEGLSKYGVYANSQEFQKQVSVIAVLGGMGGISLDEFVNNYYWQFKTRIETAINFAKNNGFENIVIPAWSWIQGENDSRIKDPNTPYGIRLEALHDSLVTYVKTLLPNNPDFPCVMYQTSSQNTYNTDLNESLFNKWILSKSPTEQCMLIANNDKFLAANPVYFGLPSTVKSGNQVHITPETSYTLGAYVGQTMCDYFVSGVKNLGVTPNSISVDGNNIIVKLNAGVYPIVVDTNWVSTINNYGFSCISPNNTDIISSVSLCYDEVTITCSSSPVGCKLRLGYVDYTSSQRRGGRKYGSRTNLRDSSIDVAHLPNGKNVILHRWAYMFEKQL